MSNINSNYLNFPGCKARTSIRDVPSIANVPSPTVARVPAPGAIARVPAQVARPVQTALTKASPSPIEFKSSRAAPPPKERPATAVCNT